LCSINLGTEVGLNFQDQRNINVQCPVETIFLGMYSRGSPYCRNILIIKKIKKYTQQKLWKKLYKKEKAVQSLAQSGARKRVNPILDSSPILLT
jgi:hypothetical protein